MANNGKITSKDIIESEKIVKEFNEVSLAVKKLLGDFSELSKTAGTFKSSLKGSGVSQKEIQLETQLGAALKERTRLQNALTRQQEKTKQSTSQTAKELAKERFETQQINKINKEEVRSKSKLVDAYSKLTIKRNAAARALRNEIVLHGKDAKSVRRLQLEFDKLNKKYVLANRASKSFGDNVGNYPTSFGKSISAIKGLVGAFGIYSGLQITKQIFNQVKELDGLNKALLQVTQTQLSFNEAQAFIKAVSDEAGANVLTLTSSYTKFLASAKTTNLTVDETENIFRQTAKAAGVLGLSTDDTNGAFRALEQILSKGKVQAEEIRGQLGERLPGAFQILAKSMGLTTQELDKQLSLGNVLSEEVLPGFAKELEKTYSLDKVERVETMAAAQNRLSNSWTEFLQNVEDGEGTISRVFTAMLDTATYIVKAFANVAKSTNKVNNELTLSTAARELEDLKAVSEETGESVEGLAKILLVDYTKSAEKAKEKIKKLKEEQLKLLIAPRQITGRGGLSESGELSANRRELEKANTSLAIRQGRLNAINEILREKKKIEDDENNDKDGVLRGTIAYYEELIKKEKEYQNTEATTRGEIADSNEKVLEYQAAIDALRGKMEKIKPLKLEVQGIKDSEFSQQIKNFAEALKLEGVDIDLAFGADAISEPLTALDEYQKRREEGEISFTKFLEEQQQKQRDAVKATFDTFAQYYGIDLEKYKSLFDGKKNTLEDYKDIAQETANFLLGNTIEKYDREIDANRARLDAILEDENTTDKEKSIAKKKAEKEEKELRKKQYKAEQNFLLAKIAIDTAANVAKILTIAALLTARPETLPFAANAYTQAAIAGGVGLAQAAFIKSRKLPQFYKGTMFAPEGFAHTDERGAEIHTDKHGKVKDWGSSKGARVKHLEKGDKIFTAQRSKRIMESFKQASSGDILQNLYNKNNQRQNYIVNNNSIEVKGVVKELKAVKSAIKNMDVNVNVTLDKEYREY